MLLPTKALVEAQQALIVARRRWASLTRVCRTPRLLGALTVCGLLVSVNWLVYVYGVNTARTADAALGYFINPLVNIMFGYVLLKERLRRAQWLVIAAMSVSSVTPCASSSASNTDSRYSAAATGSSSECPSTSR